MERDELAKIERKDAIAVYRDSLDKGVMSVEEAMNIEWWRGFYAGVDAAKSTLAGNH